MSALNSEDDFESSPSSEEDFSADGSEWEPGNDSNKYNDYVDDSDDDVFESETKEKLSGKKITSFQKPIKSNQKKNCSLMLKFKRTGKTNKRNITKKSKTPKKQNNEENFIESDSSGDDHLVNIDEIDLRLTFYNINKKNRDDLPASSNDDTKIPEFDCYQGIKEDETFSEISDDTNLDNLQKEKGNVDTMKNYNEKLLKLCKYLDDIEEAKVRIKEEQLKSEEEKKDSEKDTNLNIANLLSLGECILKNNNNDENENSVSVKKMDEAVEDNDNIENKTDEEDEWEDVSDDVKLIEENKDQNINENSIQVRIDVKEQRKLKKLLEIEALIKIEINRVIRRKQYNLHKVSLLCHLAHGVYCNRILNDPHLKSSVLHLLPGEQYHPKSPTNVKYFESLINWYRNEISLKKDTMHSFLRKKPPLAVSLSLQLQFREAICKKDFVLIFIILLRALCIQCRMVFNIVPLPIRPSLKDLCTAKMKTLNNMEQSKTLSKESSKITRIPVTQVNGEKSQESTDIRKNEEKKIANTTPRQLSGNLKATDIPIEGAYENHQKEESEESQPARNTRSSINRRVTFKEPLATHLHGDENKVEEISLESRNLRSGKRRNSVIENNLKKINTKKPKKEETLEQVSDTGSKRSQSVKQNKNENTKNKNHPLPCRRFSIRLRTKSEEKAMIQVYEDEVDATKTKKKRKTIGGIYSKEKEPVEEEEAVEPRKLRRRSESSLSVQNTKPALPEKTNKNHTIARKRFSLRLCSISDKNEISPDEKTKKVLQDIKIANNKTKANSRSSSYHLRKSTNISEVHDKENIAVDSKKTSTSREGALKKTRRSSIIPQLDGADDEDSDYSSPKEVPKPSKKLKISKSRASKRKSNKQNLKETSTGETGKKSNKMDIWLEVYCEKEKKWMCIDLFSKKVGNIESIRRCLTSPIAYVFGFNANETIKDITVRYCPNWISTSRKYRIGTEWLNKALKQHCKTSTTAIEKSEDRELNSLQKPMPKTISEFKNNPLYALERHLLKFEAIYPRNIKPLGYIRGEPIFPRDSVYILHSRDKWYKEHARIVKPDEKSYKIVSQLKWDREAQRIITVPLDIFGIWQTEPYIPPEAKNGLVPKNDYGNVELFHENMLPRGCVHLNLPGLNRICRQLNIDYASAVVGFDYHKKSIHPVTYGIIVCKEFEKKLLQIYKNEQKEIELRAKNKITERAITNWKKLIKGMAIKSKLEKRYNFNNITTSSDNTNSSSSASGQSKKRKLR